MKLSAPIATEKRGEPQLPSRRLPLISIYIMLLLLLFAVIVLAVSLGSTAIPISTIARVLLNGTGIIHFAPDWDPSIELIVWQIRMPGVIGAALVGAALAVAGALFQGLLRNPLADPFLIGTSSGAALGATLSFVLPVVALYDAAFSLTALLAFVGALLTVFFVYGIANTGGRTPVVTLLLAGVVVNSVMVALQTLLLTLFSRNDFSLQSLFNWLSGGITVSGWPPVLVVALLIIPGLLIALRLARVLDIFALGEESAAYLGLHVERYKLLLVMLASLITAAAVSISGLVGFVGLVTPHVMRLLLGPRHQTLLPASALGGAIFLVLADMLARTLIAPAVLPVGVLTALVGAPFFLFLLRRRKREYQW